MSTRTIFYLLVEWKETKEIYRSHHGWDFFWNARNEQGELIPGRIPFVKEFNPPLNISTLEHAHDASDYYDVIRPLLESELQTVCDKYFGSWFWEGKQGNYEFIAQDMVQETGIEPSEPAWFAMNQTKIVEQLKLSQRVSFSKLAKLCEGVEVSHLERINRYYTFEGYVETFRMFLEKAKGENKGIIALF